MPKTIRTSIRTMGGIGLVLSLTLSLACSDDSSSSDTTAGADTTEAPDTTNGDTSPDTSPETTGGDTTVPSGELTASWTGVTETSIKFGLAGVDPEAVRSFGIEFEGPSSQQLMTAWIAAQNERGGVLGRDIELAFTPYLPISDAQAEAACVALTEDEQVFAATGILLGDTSLCITETHETPYIGIFGQSAERDARAKVGSSRVDLQACKLEYSIVSPK